jgi:hypothetical protein
MAFTLKKAARADLDALTAQLSTRYEELSEAMEAYNAAVTEAFAPLREALAEFNGAQSDLREWAKENVIDGWRDQYEAKSETWQDSAKGEETLRLIDEWETIVESLEDYEIEKPAALDPEDLPVLAAWPEDEE